MILIKILLLFTIVICLNLVIMKCDSYLIIFWRQQYLVNVVLQKHVKIKKILFHQKKFKKYYFTKIFNLLL